tara:strand:- start:845 stop:1033 length:189 start_codon:yes stop_codon:yes gene_type:complete
MGVSASSDSEVLTMKKILVIAALLASVQLTFAYVGAADNAEDTVQKTSCEERFAGYEDVMGC